MTKTTTKPVGDLLGLLSIYRSVEKELTLFLMLGSPVHEHCITIHIFVFYPYIWGKLYTFVNRSYFIFLNAPGTCDMFVSSHFSFRMP